MKRGIGCMVTACCLWWSVGALQAMTLDSVAPQQLMTGQAASVTVTGTGLTAVTQFLLSLALGEVQTDIAKAAVLGTVYGVSGVGDLAYVAGGGQGLQIVDTQNLASPTIKGTFKTSGYALGVSVAGNLAYVADGGAGLQIIDISIPSSPVLVGHFETPGYAVGVCVVGGLAYVADLSSLQIIEVSDPAKPVLKGALAMSGAVGRVSVAGGKAHVADGGSSIKVIDVSDPTRPVLADPIDAFGKAYGVAVDGEVLFVADGGSGVRRIDLSNPASPQLLSGKFDTPGKAADVTVAGDRLYIADLSSLQVANITSVSLVGAVQMVDNAFVVGDVDEPAYVAVDGESLVIPAAFTIEVSPPSATAATFTLPTLPIAGRYGLVAVDSSNNFASLAEQIVVSPSLLISDEGWNLLGARTMIVVDQVFNHAAHYASVWKWADSGASKNWAVYLPAGKSNGALDGGASYATSKGFGHLGGIEAGEGFWVNCLTSVEPIALPGAIGEGGLTVVNGWNLVTVKSGQDMPVGDLVAAKTSSVVSLWKWEKTTTGGKNWAVYLPGGVDAQKVPDGGASYAVSKGFAHLKTISAGEGFWINVVTTEASLTLP